jgi:hypothetical protein
LSDNLKILVFAPHSAVWIHSLPEALVAEALQRGGHEIVYVGCGGLLNSHCVSMSAASVPFEAPASAKERVCRLCRKNEKLLRGRLNLEGPDLVELATAEDLSFAEALLDSTEPRSWPGLTQDGAEIGKIALYEMLIQSKRGALEFDPTEFARYRANLKNVIIVVRVTQRILDELKPDRIVLYNALYSVHRAVCRLAELRGIPQYYLHAGDNLSVRLRTLVLARNHAFHHYEHLRDQWSKLEGRPCPSDAMAAATNHLLEMARGRSIWAYSTAPTGRVDLRRKFNIAANQKVICATMSSDDERFGGEVAGVLRPVKGVLFPSQVDWIRALIDYVKTRPELFLLVRVHPREFPNRREQVLSDHAKTLQEALSTLPGNVRANWPTDGTSLYDLAAITDVFANAWSSAGREMAWLGLPVVLYSTELCLYPPQLNYVGTTEPEYFRQIEKALADGWSADTIRRTYRWSAADLFFATLDISDSFPVDEHPRYWRRVLDRAIRSVAPTYRLRRIIRKHGPGMAEAGRINRILRDELTAVIDVAQFGAPASYAEETQFLKREVRRIVEGLYEGGRGYGGDSLPGKLLRFAGS